MTDTTASENATDSVEQALAKVLGDPCAEMLRAIKVVEEHLQNKRDQFGKSLTRREELVTEIKELDKSLQSECNDLAPKLNPLIDVFDADCKILRLHPDKSADA